MTLLDQPLYDLDDIAVAGIVLPDDPSWDLVRQAANPAVDQQPAAVAIPATVEGVAAAVRYARLHGLSVAVQGTGHNAGSRATLRGSLLLRTSRLTGVEVDPEAGRVRVGAGAVWGDVAAQASAHGLAALAGSSAEVGVVGSALGGGLGWLARAYGLTANSILAAEIVTADGLHLRVDAEHEPELFWSLRGGAGAPGVVTALELSLFPVPEIYAGSLLWPWERASEVLHRWRDWAATTPDEVTSVARLVRFPSQATVAGPLRGRQFVAIEAAFLGPEAEGASLLAPLRALAPAIDTFAVVPPAGLESLRPDAPGTTPVVRDHLLLSELPRDAVDTFVEVAGAAPGSTLVSVELRQLGGALGRDPGEDGALGRLDAAFALVVAGDATAAAAAAAARHVGVALARFAAWSDGRSYLNFAGRPTDARTAFDPGRYRRLVAVKLEYDPDDVFRPGHRVPVR